jgi:hypothetical protein
MVDGKPRKVVDVRRATQGMRCPRDYQAQRVVLNGARWALVFLISL